MGCWVDYPVGQTGSWVTLHRQRPIISSDKHDNINNNSEDDRLVIAENIKTMHNSSWKCTYTGNGQLSWRVALNILIGWTINSLN